MHFIKGRENRKKYRRTLVLRPRDLWQIDLLDMQKYITENLIDICIVAIKHGK